VLGEEGGLLSYLYFGAVLLSGVWEGRGDLFLPSILNRKGGKVFLFEGKGHASSLAKVSKKERLRSCYLSERKVRERTVPSLSQKKSSL